MFEQTEQEQKTICQFITDQLMQAASMMMKLEKAKVPPEAFENIPQAGAMFNQMTWIAIVLKNNVVTKQDVLKTAEDMMTQLALQKPEANLTAEKIADRVKHLSSIMTTSEMLYDSEIRGAANEEGTAKESPILKP